jgi:uncharacterized protein (DUF2147 family)
MPLARFQSFPSKRPLRRIDLLSAIAGLALSFACAGSGGSPTLAAPATGGPEDPSGLWFTKNDGSIIKIAPCGAFYCGALVWLKEANDVDGKPKSDQFNEDSAKRGRPMVGIKLLIDLAPEKDRWRGKAYNPEDGKTYDITFKTVTDKVPGDKAEIEGCIMKILCKTDTFTRTQTIPKSAQAKP